MKRLGISSVLLALGLLAQGIRPSVAASTFIDAHNHIIPGLTPEAMISVMNELQVSKIVLMGKTRKARTTLDEGDRLTLRAYEEYPDRVIPFLGLNPVRSITPSLLDYLDRQLLRGTFRGMGELHGLHYGFQVTTPGGTRLEAPTVSIPVDSPGAQALMCLAAKHNVVLTIHMETTAETVAALERALEQNPYTKIIWAHQYHFKTVDGPGSEHARKADPQQIAALMEKYPRLYADIAPAMRYFTEGDRQLPDRWKSLYERYSNRFVVGYDLPFPFNWQKPQMYRRKAAAIRGWISQLSIQAQQRFAYSNIERILAAKPASIKTCEFTTK
jgi:Tat protein secretion system quality control protein TatD with DNase activity